MPPRMERQVSRGERTRGTVVGRKKGAAVVPLTSALVKRKGIVNFMVVVCVFVCWSTKKIEETQW